MERLRICIVTYHSVIIEKGNADFLEDDKFNRKAGSEELLAHPSGNNEMMGIKKTLSTLI